MPLLVMFSSGHTEFSVTLQIHARENSDAENLENLGRKWVLYCCDD